MTSPLSNVKVLELAENVFKDDIINNTDAEVDFTF